MSLGAGILLFVIGAILAFAIQVDVPGVDLNLVGYILMVAGLIGVVIGIVLLTRKRQSVSTSRTFADPATGERVSKRVSEVDDTDLR